MGEDEQGALAVFDHGPREMLVRHMVSLLDGQRRRFVSGPEAAVLCGVSEATVTAWMTDGRLAFVRTPDGELRCPVGEVIVLGLLCRPPS